MREEVSQVFVVKQLHVASACVILYAWYSLKSNQNYYAKAEIEYQTTFTLYLRLKGS